MTAPTSAVAASLDSPPTRRLQRRTVRALVVAQIVGAIGIGVTPSVGVLLAQQVTHSDMWAGLARTGSTLGAAIGGLPLAALAARRGRRWALTTGWTVSGLGAALLIAAAQLQDLAALVIGLLVTGVGTAAQLQARFAATDLATPARKARALSTVVWVGSIGSVLGPNLGGPGEWLAHRLQLADLAGAYVFATAALLLAGLLTAALLRPDPLLTALAITHTAPDRGIVQLGTEHALITDEDIVESEPLPRSRKRFAILTEVTALCRTNPAVALALTAMITAQVLMVTVMTMAPVQMSDEGSSLTIVGISISLHIVGMYGLAPVAGAVADKLGTAAGVTIGVVLFAGSFALAITDKTSIPVVTVSLVLLGLGWSFMSVAGAGSLSTNVTQDRRAPVQGFADSSTNLAAATGAFLGGPIMAIIGYNGLAAVAALTMIPLCLLLLARRHPPKAIGPAPAL